MDNTMSHAEAVAYLKKKLKLRTDNNELILLHALKSLLPAAEGEAKQQCGIQIIGFASSHKLTDRALLKFFETSLDDVRQSVGDEFLSEHGLYRSLVTSPQISSVCEIFFDGWLAAAYKENPLKCLIRRVGLDAFRVVSVLPDGAEVEFSEDITILQAQEVTTCPEEELLVMPVLQ